MKKTFNRKNDKGNLRPEYDLNRLMGGVRGKYYDRARAGTNLVLLEPAIARAFPDAESVNHALRLLLNTARASAGVNVRRGRSKGDGHEKRRAAN